MLNVILGLASFGFFTFLVLTIQAAIKKKDKLVKRIIFTVIFFTIVFVLGRVINSGYELPEGSGGFIFFGLVILVLLYFLIKNQYITSKAKEQLGAYISYHGVHMYGIPNIPEMSRVNLHITADKLIIDQNQLRFELPLIHIRGAAAVPKESLSQKSSPIYREGVSTGSKLKPWEVVGGGVQAIANYNYKGPYLAIDYATASGDINLMIFNLMNISHAKKAANALSFQTK